MSERIFLRGQLGESLTVDVQGYEQPNASDVHDANWLRCSVEVRQHGFGAVLDVSLATDDFGRFLAALDRMSAHRAASAGFETVEATLEFRVDAGRTGRVTVIGKVCELGESGLALTFGFESDRASLAEAHSGLQRVVSAFPERNPNP